MTPAPARRSQARRPQVLRGSAVATLAAATLALSACGSAEPTDGAAGAGTLSVVASTDVYGDLARAVAGDRAEVVSIIDDAAQDPHSYEASTRDQLALQRATVVVGNGGGYDPFIDTMLEAVGTEGKTVITAVELAEETPDEQPHADEGHAEDAHAHGHDGLNEHVWYDLATMRRVTEELVEALSAASPDDAALFEANGTALAERIAALQDRQAELRAAVEGTAVAITEPVPVHMLDALGLEDRTPPEFSEAMEEGHDVPPAVMQEALELFSTGQVAVLVYNEQTSGPQTERVGEAARAAGVPVVPVTETLPDGKDYPTWMGDTLTALEQALTR